MKEKKHLFTRRDFLHSALVASASTTIPFFLSNPFIHASPEGSPIQGFPDDRILVMVQLSGGNDGLNTVIPHRNDDYYRARPQFLGLKKDQMLSITDELSLHKSLAPLKNLHDQGKFAVINGVGYPNPNRSHFRSMDIWHTASDSDIYAKEGWIGRYFDHCCTNSKPQNTSGINIGPKLPYAFEGNSDIGVSFDNPRNFKWHEGVTTDTQQNFRKLNKVNQKSSATPGSNLDYLRSVTANAIVSSDQVVKIGSKNRAVKGYNQAARIGRDLKIVADLITGRLPTRIYYVSFGGFDTHANQPNQHANLLRQLATGLATFYEDLKKSGMSKKVLVTTFSEFGRRVKENGSRGSDHGTAGPMFMMGEMVNAGSHGQYPSLSDLDKGDLKFTTDFRSVYATILESWFKVESSKVLGKTFPKLDLLTNIS